MYIQTGKESIYDLFMGSIDYQRRVFKNNQVSCYANYHTMVLPSILSLLKIVRRLKTKFERNGDMADESTKCFPHVFHHHNIKILRGATSSRWRMVAILDFQDGCHIKSTSANISTSKLLTRSFLMSNYIFYGSRNVLKLL